MRLSDVIKEWCKKYWRLILSFIISILLVWLDYAFQNISFPVLDDVTWISIVDYELGDLVENKKKFFDESSVTYVNFSKDKALVPVTDIFGDTIGTDVITNRETILRFLELADSSDYEYIFLDVRFEKGDDTPFDSALFARIKAMPRLVIATHRDNGDYEIADLDLLAKAAYADYRGTMFSGFTRYEFLQDGCRSVALQMLHDIDNQDIKKGKLYYYTSDGKCCYNLKYIPLPHYLFKSKDGKKNDTTSRDEMRYLYAGSMVVNPQYISRQEVIQNLLNDKIIIAGDFDNDLHSTFIGEIPGPVLSLAAYQYLQAGLHKVSFLYVLILFALYFFVAYFILKSGGHIANFFENKPVLHFILSLFSLSFFFLIVKAILYSCLLISMIMLVPSIVFWVMSAFLFAKNESQKGNMRWPKCKLLKKEQTKNKPQESV